MLQIIFWMEDVRCIHIDSEPQDPQIKKLTGSASLVPSSTAF